MYGATVSRPVLAIAPTGVTPTDTAVSSAYSDNVTTCCGSFGTSTGPNPVMTTPGEYVRTTSTAATGVA